MRKGIDLVQRKQGQEDEDLIGLRRCESEGEEEVLIGDAMKWEEERERMGRRMRRTITKTITILYRPLSNSAPDRKSDDY